MYSTNMHAPVKLVLIETKKILWQNIVFTSTMLIFPQKTNNADRFRKYYPTLKKWRIFDFLSECDASDV
jgi:hypothetical protein